jgi:hypothetical protein
MDTAFKEIEAESTNKMIILKNNFSIHRAIDLDKDGRAIIKICLKKATNIG